MTLHETIKRNVATAIANSDDVLAFCQTNFGRGCKVLVNIYGAQGWPGEEDAPFVFIYSDGENEIGNVDEETFEFAIVVGGADSSDSPTVETTMERGESSNGLVVRGIADKVEALRNIVEAIVKEGNFGAIYNTATRTESDALDYPLEWAQLRVSFYEPQSL